ncbi:MAG: sulfite reductase subunit alpha [Puniceicoccales bacterium]|jgi:sulfite reductase (NADPH) flavoprotein alpha-component|nr:sulfite reductase subunit alpha [Puniceicoccales bacterium]
MSGIVANIHDRNHPFLARITERRRLTSAAGEKEAVHLAVDIAGSGIKYTCGDSLGVLPTNNPDLVNALLKALNCDGTEPVHAGTDTITFRQALSTRFLLSGVTKNFLQLIYERATSPEEKATAEKVLASDQMAQKAWLEEREFIDIAEEFPSAKIKPEELIAHLRKLSPRLYSIASAPSRHPETVELAIAVVRYTTNGRQREGVCSTYLAARAPLDKAELPVFLAPSNFALPHDDSAPLIMVGPGVGIAPFRSFLQERATRRASGKNWLFFGDWHRADDFLYEDELNAWLQDGVLTELSTAWSRDQEHKIYVQDRMRERGAELWQWLENGAYFYVCGDARHMAKDVDAALHEIVAEYGSMSPESAAEYIRDLKHSKRYQRDVY